MAKPKSCSLVCLQRSHDPIPLPDGVAVTLGRSPQTRIIDPRCSRNQVELSANWTRRTVNVRQLGSNNTAIDGSVIGLSKEATLKVNSTLFILSGQYPHQVLFGEENSDKAIRTLKNGIQEGTDNQSQSQSQKNPSKISESKETEPKAEKKSVKRQNSDDIELSDCKKKKVESSSEERDKIMTKTDKDNDKSSHRSKSASNSKSTKTSSSHKHSSNSSSNASELKIRNEKKIDSDEDTEHLKGIKAKLKQIQQGAKHGTSKTSSSKDVSHSHISSSLSRDLPGGSASATSSLKSFKTNSSSSSKKSLSTSESPWATHEHLYVFTSKGVEDRSKIAGFDIDGTIIVTKSGKTFPQDSSDWKIAYPEIFGKIKQLHKDGFKIVFFTNQLGVARGKVKIEDLKTKIENIISHLHMPVQVFIATNTGRYRKPMDGMWKKLKSQYNGGISIDTSSSVYVGDAAGRLADWEPKKKKDFSSSDRLFAINVGVKFYTPEEYFLKRKPAKFNMPVFDPRALSSQDDWIPKESKLTLDTKEVIILVGFPACGKSHFAKYVLKPKGYVVVNRDTLGTWQKCVKMTQEAVVNSSVVVDNTNLTKEERSRYVKCAGKEGVPCRCFLFTASIDHCRHNERFREMTDKSHAKINEMIFNKIKNSYQEPNMSEGFSEIVKISFVPKFSSSSLEIDYRKFLLEK